MVTDPNRKTISVKTETYKRIGQFFEGPGDTSDKVINRLIDIAESLLAKRTKGKKK